MAWEKVGWMINVNDLVYCRNSGLQVLTINSHTHPPPPFLCLFGFFLTSLFVSCSMGFFTHKEGIYFSINIFWFSFVTCYFILDVLVCFFFLPEFHVLLLWYPWLLPVVRCVWALCKGLWLWRWNMQVHHKASYLFFFFLLNYSPQNGHQSCHIRLNGWSDITPGEFGWDCSSLWLLDSVTTVCSEPLLSLVIYGEPLNVSC